jgi:hypothetical protein
MRAKLELEIKLARNVDTERWSYKISWTDLNGASREGWVAREKKFSQKEIWEMLLQGGHPGPASPDEKSRWWKTIEEKFRTADSAPYIRVTSRSGWLDEQDVFLLPGEKRTLKGVKYLHAQDGSGAGAAPARKCRGALSAWCSGLQKPCMHSPYLTTAIALAFAGPALRFSTLPEAPGLYFVGESGVGKTTLLRAGHSVFGSARSLDLRSWDATDAALQEGFSETNGLTMFVDEVGAIGSDVARRLQAFAFTTGSGRGRSRSRAVRDVLPQLTWSACAATTGELSLDDIFAEGRATLVDGVRHRLIEVRVPPVARGGIFIAPRADPRRLHHQVEQTLELNFGLAIKPWIRFLEREAPEVRSRIAELTRGFEMRWTKELDDWDNLTARIRAKFVFLAAVAELAAEADVAPWRSGEGEKRIFRVWRRLEERRRRPSREAMKAARVLLRLLDRGCTDVIARSSVRGRDVVAIDKRRALLSGLSGASLDALVAEACSSGALYREGPGRLEAKVRIEGSRTRRIRICERRFAGIAQRLSRIAQ